MMIRHIIMWHLHEEAEGFTKAENALRIKEQLNGLPAIISQIDSWEVGINRTSVPHAWDVVLVADFADEDALKIYQQHPAHRKFIEFIDPLRANRHVVDYLR